jgi:hypothetical protein
MAAASTLAPTRPRRAPRPRPGFTQVSLSLRYAVSLRVDAWCELMFFGAGNPRAAVRHNYLYHGGRARVVRRALRQGRLARARARARAARHARLLRGERERGPAHAGEQVDTVDLLDSVDVLETCSTSRRSACLTLDLLDLLETCSTCSTCST